MAADRVAFTSASAARIGRAVRAIERLAPRAQAAGFGGKRDRAGTGGGGGVQDVRWNATSKKLEKTYVADPEESDWEEIVTFVPCVS